MAYDNNNSGVLFRNDNKQDGDRLPDYRGNCEVNGVKLDIAAWINTSQKNGKKFMSIKFSPPFKKEKQPDPGAFVPPPPKSTEADDEQVPF